LKMPNRQPCIDHVLRRHGRVVSVVPPRTKAK